MNKKELRKKLEELYLEGLVKRYWDEYYLKDGDTLWADGVDSTHPWGNEVETTEKLLHGYEINSTDAYKSAPFQKALKRWEELKNSPLYKALE